MYTYVYIYKWTSGFTSFESQSSNIPQGLEEPFHRLVGACRKRFLVTTTSVWLPPNSHTPETWHHPRHFQVKISPTNPKGEGGNQTRDSGCILKHNLVTQWRTSVPLTRTFFVCYPNGVWIQPDQCLRQKIEYAPLTDARSCGRLRRKIY